MASNFVCPFHAMERLHTDGCRKKMSAPKQLVMASNPDGINLYITIKTLIRAFTFKKPNSDLNNQKELNSRL